MGIDRSGLSPAVLAKVVYAGTTLGSFATAEGALAVLAEVDVPAKQVERRTHAIGIERCVERDAATKTYLALPLSERKGVPAGVSAPALAVVQMDGGRLQIFDRKTPPVEGDAADATAKKKGRYWREDKVGVLASMTSTVSVADPCPHLPEHFVDATRVEQLVKEIKAKANAGESPPSDNAVSLADGKATSSECVCSTYEPPELGIPSVVATKADAYRFGEFLACAAWQRGFYGSSRRAFLGDGSSTNWGVWARHFSSFTPVVDFIHALTYVYQGAMAGRSVEAGWSFYVTWITALWSGDVSAVIAGLEVRQRELGEPEETDGETSPRRKLAESLGYFLNQRDRMKYASYRREGLPITTCHVESMIKRRNRRVKGTEKFWSESGSEAILQLRADVLSETNPLEEFWTRRTERTTGERCQTPRIAPKTLAA